MIIYVGINLIVFTLFRFANIPDIIELDHLTVSGDVTFGRGVSLRVSFICESTTYKVLISISFLFFCSNRER